MEQCILVVDDEKIIRELVQDFLTCTGYKVVTAANGKEAVDKVRARRSCFNLILMDLLMPEMNGYEAIEILHREAPEIPVIILSGSGNSGHLAVNRDMNELPVISKPFDVQTLEIEVKKALSKK